MYNPPDFGPVAGINEVSDTPYVNRLIRSRVNLGASDAGLGSKVHDHFGGNGLKNLGKGIHVGDIAVDRRYARQD